MYFEKLNYIMKHTHTHIYIYIIIIKRFKLHNYNFFYINGEDVIIKRTFQKYTMIAPHPKIVFFFFFFLNICPHFIKHI